MLKQGIKANKMLIFIAVMSVYFSQGATNGIGACVAAFSEYFPNVEFTTVMLLSTIPYFVAVPSGLLVGPMVNKLGYKNTLYISLAIFLVGGIIPYFIYNNFGIILLGRMVNGFGFGLLYPLGASMATAYFDSEEASKVIGYGGIFNSLSTIVFSNMAAMLVSTKIQNVWFVHLLMLITLACVLFIPEPISTESAKDEISKSKSNEKLTAKSWFYICQLAMMTLFFFTLFLYASPLVTSAGLGDSRQASFVITANTICGMICGFTFGSVYNKLGEKIYVVASICVFVGFGLIYTAQSIVPMYIGSFISAQGFFWVLSASMVGISKVTPALNIPTANGIATCGLNIFAFLATYIHSFLANLFNMDPYRFPFIAGIVFYVIMFIFYIAKKSKIDN